MRVVKFRFWCKREKAMSRSYTLDDLRLGASILSPCKDDVTMQYTGLHDKNGVEIFEGDILRFPDMGEEGYEHKEGFDFTNQAVVCFENGRFELEKFYDDNSAVLDEMNRDHEEFITIWKTSEIIGNVFENPELIGGSDEVKG